MAKKSNKTAHVLNLLTTHEENKNDVSAIEVPSEPHISPTGKDNKRKNTIKIEKASSDLLSDIIQSELERQFEISSQQNGTTGEVLLHSNESLSGKDENKMTNYEQSTPQFNDNNSTDYITVNIVEDLIKTKAPNFVKKIGGCFCYRCINDVIAMTLNILPPKYIVTERGMLFAKIASYENQYSTDVTTALTKACMQVKDSPRH